ncbi:MAG: glycine dehydrogenase [Bacteroidetes bacterium]|nr:MAG: glycine dehydrogenase [Bacteroidota bacterium]
MSKDVFTRRHIGPSESDVEAMLRIIGVSSIDELIEQTIPASIRLKKPLQLPEGLTEFEYLKHLHTVGAKNKTFRSYIGLGYYGTIVPPVIQRNILENPGWYTAYTPYQAEISQGRLEALLNFQTMVIDLTGLPLANASLLDEATAAGESMTLLFGNRSREAVKRNAHKFFVSEKCFPQTLDVLRTRSAPLGIELVTGDHGTFKFDDSFFGALVQYPDIDGEIHDFTAFAKAAHDAGAGVAVGTDLLALAMLPAPGEWGADVVFGNSQRFGVPMGFGGPHAAFFAAKEDFKRLMPGRIIGVSIDSNGNRALRMALQTREQHIKREKATSNICTAQALLAIMASMYAVYHGPEGIRSIAEEVHGNTARLSAAAEKAGYQRINKNFFDTLSFRLPAGKTTEQLKSAGEALGINFRYGNGTVHISLDQTVGADDLRDIVQALGADINAAGNGAAVLKPAENRKYLTHPVFSSYHSETEMMRYIKRLENKDLSLVHSMISLGSCTMKLNAAAELYPISWPEFAGMHPFVPAEQAKGYHEVFENLEKALCGITGFAAMSFQPNSGAQGEYAGLMVIRAYHISRGDTHRNLALIPSSAHGTNPASAALAGMNIVIVKCDDQGNIDVNDLRAKAEQHKDNLSCLMVTYPSTHGVFEESIIEITKIIHDNGGQVYMDGANMNAQVGLTSPGNIGADVCHLNLHKTFAIPHGGGGPGMGPIGVAAHLAPFLPSHPVVKTGGQQGIPAVSAAPWGSALILLISYGYVKMLGGSGVTDATKYAILNANYMKEVLKPYYNTLYTNRNGRVAHEMILDCAEFKRTAKVEVGDMAKRLMDFGYHAPTVSFPVHDTLMIEPTESESKAELDRFCQAMIRIRKEIAEIAEGKSDVTDNVLKNAPHTAVSALSESWNHTYSREKAVFPLAWVRDAKFWPSVGRVDNAYGDRNLVCSCPPIEAYETEAAL